MLVTTPTPNTPGSTRRPASEHTPARDARPANPRTLPRTPRPATPRTSPRAPRRDAAENREALLASAKVMLNQDPAASLEAIAAHAGLSRRAVYGHFATRDELLRELLTLGATRVAAAAESVDHPDPVVRLALIASRLWREVADVRVTALFAVRGPLKDATARALAPLRASVHAAIAQAAENGSIRTDVPVDRLARLVEDAALSVLEESARTPLRAADGHRLVMLMTLGTVGLGWRECESLIDSTPELEWSE
jgi:AcrR family transcriptional regulator